MEKIKIMCDTNVLYGIIEGSHRNLPDEYDIVTSHLVFGEIISSPKWEMPSEFDKIKKVLELFDNGVVGVMPESLSYKCLEMGLLACEENGIKNDFLDSLWRRKEEYSAVVFNEMGSLVKKLLAINSVEELPQSTKNGIRNRDYSTKEFSKYMGNELEIARNQRKNGNPHTVKEISFDFLENMIFDGLKLDFFQGEQAGYFQDFQDCFMHSKSTTNLLWLLDCFPRYFAKKADSKDAAMQKNDFVDFFNLVYCCEERKYLTSENKILDILEGSDFKDIFLSPLCRR